MHATLLDSYVAGHAQFGRPMSRPEIDSFYREYRDLGRLVGVRARDLPASWDGFREYFATTVQETMCRNQSVDRVLRSVTNAAPPVPLPDPPWRVLRMPAQQALWVGGLGLIPPPLRQRFGVRWSTREERSFRALGAISRQLTPVMPHRLQVMGPDQLRLRGRAIASGPLGGGWAGAQAQRVAV